MTSMRDPKHAAKTHHIALASCGRCALVMQRNAKQILAMRNDGVNIVHEHSLSTANLVL
jgi:hypothetical protein